MIARLVVALVTRKRFLSGVLAHVQLQVRFTCRLVITDLADVRLQLGVHGLNMLFQTFTIRAHLLTDLTALGRRPVGQLHHRLAEMHHGVVGQLIMLIEPFVADITLVEAEIGVGLAMLLQGRDCVGSVGQTLDALV